MFPIVVFKLSLLSLKDLAESFENTKQILRGDRNRTFIILPSSADIQKCFKELLMITFSIHF